MTTTDLLNKRILVRYEGNNYNSTLQEFKILEVSGSGNYIKVMNSNGTKFWVVYTDLSVIELLIDLENK